MQPKTRFFATSFAVALLLDQLTKLWIVRNLSRTDSIPIIDGFFTITHVRNPGAAFGLFTGLDESVRVPLFLGVSLAAVILVLRFQRSLEPGDRLSATALGLILGGAVGNLVDRIRYGEVVDFLHFRLWRGYVWPDFNLADSFIVVGVALLVIELVVGEGEQRAAEGRDRPG